jgi:predicted RNA-binding Zn-ribbon protein involved in translation (DUF1610 family)
MANADSHTLYNMPVRRGGFLDNRSMLKITCDSCGLHIDPEEMIVCMPCGEDLHVMCAASRLENAAWWDKTRTLSYAERMNEYMQERFRNGQSQRDLQEIMSALKLDTPRHTPPALVRQPRRF